MKTLKDLFLEELADIYDAEKRMVKALPKMADAALSTELKQAFASHLAQTKDHVSMVAEVFSLFDAEPSDNQCEATMGLLQEADEIVEVFEDSPALDAALICAAQKVEHYEIASYGCLQTWANLLGNADAEAILREILAEERAADTTLSALARAHSNEEALA